MARPPASLLTDCPPINSIYEKDTLLLLKAGDTHGAAMAHTRYVFDVRDAYDKCSEKVMYLREYLEGLHNGQGTFEP